MGPAVCVGTTGVFRGWGSLYKHRRINLGKNSAGHPIFFLLKTLDLLNFKFFQDQRVEDSGLPQ